MVTRRQMSVAQLNARRAELSALKAHRGLIPAEQRELDNLDHRFYMRAWHARQHAAERALRRAGA